MMLILSTSCPPIFNAEKSRPASRTALLESLELVGEEWSAQSLVATAAPAVLPLHLDHPVVAAESLVEPGAVARRLRGAELEVALVGIFLAAGIKPGIQVRISDGFFRFVGHDVGHAISSAYARGRAVRTSSLDFTGVGALLGVADKRPLDIGAVQGLMSVEAAELGARSEEHT